MADRTGIEWTDATWNPLRGCSRVSEGCRNCYAEKVAARFSGPGQPYEGLATRSPARWTGQVRLVEKHLDDPLRWRKPRRVFVNSMSDLFHESVPDEYIDGIFAVMALAPQHTFQVLTKRPERMLAYIASRSDDVEHGDHLATAAYDMTFGPGARAVSSEDTVALARGRWPFAWPLSNVWLGVSVEDQETADERIPLLLETPAAVRFVSAEPLLGPVDFGMDSEVARADPDAGHYRVAWLGGFEDPEFGHMGGLDWIIVGGESGPGARDFDVEWARSIIVQCRAAGVPCFVKQLGESVARSVGCRDRKGGDPSEWPEDLRVREFPQGTALVGEGGES